MSKDQKDQMVDQKRRNLLGTTLAGAAMLGTATVGAAERKSRELPWDMQTDIVCVGSGAAACAAAVTAVDLGSKVILLEKAPVFGGTTRRSGGVAWIPNNFSLQADNVVDAEEDCMRYMCRYAYPAQYRADSPTLGLDPADFALLQAFYRNAAPAVVRLNEIGATHFRRMEVPGGFGPPSDYAADFPENKVPKGRAVRPDGKINGGSGAGLVDGMIEWLGKRGARLLAEHRVVSLVQRDGRVIGVEAEHGGKRLRIQARKGVIFGSGGFAHNLELIARYQDPIYGSCASAGATGDFIAMAGAVGARMGNLGTAWRNQAVLEETLENRVAGQLVHYPPGDAMILVNKYGRRVVNEKRNYNDRGRIHAAWDPARAEYPNQFLFMLFDQRAIDVFGGTYPLPQDVRASPYLISGASVAELSGNIQARLEKLRGKIGDILLATDFARQTEESIRRFNGYARSGVDAEFQRGAPLEIDWMRYFSRPRPGKESMIGIMPNLTMHPFTEQGPYYALIIAPAVLDTSGGPQINARAQVMGSNGKPVPGLYGAGNCIASPAHTAYFGAGGTIGPALTFGYVAAHAAHRDRAAA